MFGKRKKSKEGASKLKEWIREKTESGKKIPEYIAAIGRMVAPRASVIWDAIAKIGADDEIEIDDKEVLLEILQAMLKEAKITMETHEIDMRSDSWLSKNVRPITLFILVSNTLAIFWYYTITGSDPLVEWDRFWKAMAGASVLYYYGERGVMKYIGSKKPL